MDALEGIQLRNASLADIQSLIDFWAENGENASRPTDSPVSLERLIVRDPEALILAIRDDRIVGTVIAGWDGWRGAIYRLAVAETLRGNGLGKKLMQLAEERLRNLGTDRSLAMVLESNGSAHRFYQSLGYAQQDDWRRWVKEI